MIYWPTSYIRYVRRDSGTPCLTLQQWWVKSFRAASTLHPPEAPGFPGEWRDVPVMPPLDVQPYAGPAAH